MTSPGIDPARLERVFVLGLGLSGTAAVRLLRGRGIAVVASDRRAADELGADDLARDPGVELRLADHSPELPSGLDALVVSPGVGLGHPLLRQASACALPIIAEVELAWSFLHGSDATMVGITGSNGKSTTTAMTGALLAGAGFAVEVCGNIGRPLAAVVDGPPGRIFVVELSSFQLETIVRFRPRAAALLNISPDHLDRHGDLAGYLAAKRRIFLNQGEEDAAVLNADEPEVAASRTAARKRFFSSAALGASGGSGFAGAGCRLLGDQVLEHGDERDGELLFERRDLSLPGLHNVENAMAAALLARAVGAPAAAIAPALVTFRGLPHRVERVAEVSGIAFVDDSKGTNVAATARSLEGFGDASVHVILGGRNKGADFRFLREVVARKARRAYLIGESSADLERALAGAVACELAGELPAAVAMAAAAARPGETVLLSPACASFDQFRDYIDRGRQFAALARALAAPENRLAVAPSSTTQVVGGRG